MSELPSTRALRYWSKQAGGFYNPNGLKGTTGPQGWMYKVKRGNGNYSGNNNPKPRHYTALLVANARARGFINGVSIRTRQ